MDLREFVDILIKNKIEMNVNWSPVNDEAVINLGPNGDLRMEFSSTSSKLEIIEVTWNDKELSPRSIDELLGVAMEIGKFHYLVSPIAIMKRTMTISELDDLLFEAMSYEFELDIRISTGKTDMVEIDNGTDSISLELVARREKDI